MNRLQNTARIVAASLKNNPHIAITEVPDLIRTIHSSLPADPPMAEQPREKAEEAPAVQDDLPGGDGDGGTTFEGGDGSVGDADEPGGRKSWSEALAASRARFGGGDAEQTSEADEAEVEAHAS